MLYRPIHSKIGEMEPCRHGRRSRAYSPLALRLGDLAAFLELEIRHGMRSDGRQGNVLSQRQWRDAGQNRQASHRVVSASAATVRLFDLRLHLPPPAAIARRRPQAGLAWNRENRS